jgi:hypothetical protein
VFGKCGDPDDDVDACCLRAPIIERQLPVNLVVNGERERERKTT